MERLPRVLPFWMMLLGIVGFFVLGVMYLDVRGRETRSPLSPTNVEVEHVQPSSELLEPTGDATTTAEVPVPLALPPETPASDIPAVAAYACWRFEARGDRIVVDRAYEDMDTFAPARVTSETLLLDCSPDTYVTRAQDNQTYYFHAGDTNSPLNNFLEPGALYQVDPYTGSTARVALTTLPPHKDMFHWEHHIGLSPDEKFVDIAWSYVDGDPTLDVPSTIQRIDLATGAERIFSSSRVHTKPIWNPSHTAAISIEWTCDKHSCDQYPAFLHRYNLETGKTVRVGEVFDWNPGNDPLFIDDERVVVSGENTPAFVMNIYSRATAPIKEIIAPLTAPQGRLAITTDRSQIVVTGPNQPLTVIPVSELPKP